MRRKIFFSITALSAFLLAALLGGCGSANKEGASDPLSTVTRVDNSNCTNACHAAAVSPVTGKNIVFEWMSSAHFKGAELVDCQSCHGGGSLHFGVGPIPHPNPDNDGVCSAGTCHPALGFPHTPKLTPAILASATIWDNMSSAGYVTSQNTNKCRTCHNPHNNTVLQQNRDWGQSGHADKHAAPWIHYDFKARTPCNRCHTTTGYIKFVTTGDTQAWATANSSDKTKEVLRCDGCHQDYSWKRRVLAPVKLVYTPSDGSSAQLANYFDSNICINCHSGLESGIEIVQAKTIQTTFGSFNSHYLAGAGVLFRKIGYLYYAATSYANNISHVDGIVALTSPGSGGPCVECHMANSASDHSHLYLPVFRDANNQITDIDANSLCNNCHAWTPASLQTVSDFFDSALTALNNALQLKGIFYLPASYPYFYKSSAASSGAFTNWSGVGGTNAAGKNIMGAAFNLNALFRTPGSYAHNGRYGLELIYDALDWLDDGILNGTPTTNANSATNVFNGIARP